MTLIRNMEFKNNFGVEKRYSIPTIFCITSVLNIECRIRALFHKMSANNAKD